MSLDSLKKEIIKRILEFSPEINISAEELVSKFEIPKDKQNGDLAFPCFVLSRALRKSPAEIAGQLGSLVSDIEGAAVSTAGPYINFTIDTKQRAQDILKRVFSEKEKYGSSCEFEGKTLCIDFSAPNIAKPFGIGHLRSTVIGNALSRIYESQGYKVVRINHLGDWGKQFGLLDVAFSRWGDEAALEADPILHLYELYVKVNRLVEEGDEALDEAGREAFRELEEGNPERVKVWERFRKLSIREFRRVYERLDIGFDSFSGEAFYNDKMDATIQRLEEKGLITESQGARVVDLEEEGLGVAIIQKSNGSTTYLTRDLATAEFRHGEYGFDRMLYVVGQPQELHFKQLFTILEKMGYDWVDECEHIMFGYIRGMSTRKGTIVFLDDVLNEAAERVRARMNEISVQKVAKDDIDSVAEDIGLTAVMFSDMKNRRIKDIEFDWDRLLSLQGDTGPYLQNALARIFGVFRKNNEITVTDQIDFSLLSEAKARDLITLIGEFPDTLSYALRVNEPSVITGYLLNLAKQFHSGYNELRIKDAESETAQARLLLFDAIRQVLENGFRLLGFRVLEEM